MYAYDIKKEKNIFIETNKNREPTPLQKIQQAKQYISNQKNTLFYPGTGTDIIHPILLFHSVCDTFVYADNNYGQDDSRYRKDILEKRLMDFLQTKRINVKKYGRTWDENLVYTWIEFTYNNATKKIKYFHDSWQNALSYLKKNNQKISIFYIITTGGEGGVDFEMTNEFLLSNQISPSLADHFIAYGQLWYNAGENGIKIGTKENHDFYIRVI